MESDFKLSSSFNRTEFEPPSGIEPETFALRERRSTD